MVEAEGCVAACNIMIIFARSNSNCILGCAQVVLLRGEINSASQLSRVTDLPTAGLATDDNPFSPSFPAAMNTVKSA
jgi:hypothetical protein